MGSLSVPAGYPRSRWRKARKLAGSLHRGTMCPSREPYLRIAWQATGRLREGPRWQASTENPDSSVGGICVHPSLSGLEAWKGSQDVISKPKALATLAHLRVPGRQVYSPSR